MPIQRTAVNPWPWSVDMGFNQGEVVEGYRRTLFCAGQTAMSAEGQPQHAGDMTAQVAMAVDNLEAVLARSWHGPGQRGAVEHLYDRCRRVLRELRDDGRALGVRWRGPAGHASRRSRLAFPELMVEIEATAVD